MKDKVKQLLEKIEANSCELYGKVESRKFRAPMVDVTHALNNLKTANKLILKLKTLTDKDEGKSEWRLLIRKILTQHIAAYDLFVGFGAKDLLVLQHEITESLKAIF